MNRAMQAARGPAASSAGAPAADDIGAERAARLAAPAPASASADVDAAGTVSGDPWARLRASTPARIGLRRSGDALTTCDQLELRLAHARARDAVHAALDVEALRATLDGRPVIAVASAAPDRATYLQRPDLGRELAGGEAERLRQLAASPAGPASSTPATPVVDLALILADGLSPVAVERHGPAMVGAIAERLPDWTLAPVIVATQARVAIGDPVGEALGARFAVVLIGERPGLSAADSLGVYVTLEPRPGRRDSERNCISNVRPPVGTGYDEAADLLVRLLHGADRLGTTGVQLKDGAPSIEG